MKKHVKQENKVKTCKKCKTDKEEDSFGKSKKHADGLLLWCKECTNEQKRVHYSNWKENNPDAHALKKQKDVEYHLGRKYKITLDEYNSLMNQQDYKCSVCGVNQSDVDTSFAVDHDHITCKVRGLLCFKCNAGIGLLGDSVAGLQKAIDYLQEHYAQDINDIKFFNSVKCGANEFTFLKCSQVKSLQLIGQLIKIVDLTGAESYSSLSNVPYFTLKS